MVEADNAAQPVEVGQSEIAHVSQCSNGAHFDVYQGIHANTTLPQGTQLDPHHVPKFLGGLATCKAGLTEQLRITWVPGEETSSRGKPKASPYSRRTTKHKDGRPDQIHLMAGENVGWGGHGGSSLNLNSSPPH